MTQVLVAGELNVLGQIRTASNVTLVCEAVLGDERMRCVYKPIQGEQPLWDFPDGTLAGREVASYRISEALGWNAIPETILRDGPYGEGMVQRWVTSAGPELVDLTPVDAVPDGYREVLRGEDTAGNPVSLSHADDPRLFRLAVLDIVLNNADRKGGHALNGEDGYVYGVDHGICLHSEPKLRTVLWGWAGERIPEELVDDLRRLISSPLELGDYLTATEISALRQRTKRLIDTPVLPFPGTRRPIPWPPF
ncbi:SCO1664 family protein [Smaragdicoccus niigatensis]|uniref:SCO1664 family protein n=1 Tax=Smaragdicoccus niigatensis TaxID=359359 RepID=UPI0003828068|nr:SCO1664 family protein [Smaragdicoccus niigatensis]